MRILLLGLVVQTSAAACASSPPPPTSDVAVAPASTHAVAAASTTPRETSAPAPVRVDEEAAAVPSTPVSSCGLTATIAPKADGNGYKLTLKNASRQTVKLVAAGDGSEAGWRTPSIAWTGTSGGKPAKELEGGRCGMMNAIEKSEVFSIAPGGSHTIDQWIHGPAYAKGTYEVRLRYTNDPKKLARKSSSAPDVTALLESTTACEVTSAPLTITIP